MSLQHQKIVIIGGSSGIGLATAQAAQEGGATVVIASRSEEKLKRAKEQLKGEVRTYSLDISNIDEVKRFFTWVGEFDHLVTTAGETANGSCLDMDIEVARKSFDNKFWGQYYAAKYSARQIKKGGSIVLIAGVLGVRPLPNTAIMTSVNSAVEGLGRALAVELAPIRVNIVSPGYTNTPRIANMPEKDREMMFQKIAEQLPVGRVGEPQDIAQSLLYLISNGFVTGTTLFVDGGYTLR
jgi:NAD(P)-dependent dehydrogenase (short-subunit alcohol dehydrogenase family)